MKPRNRAPLLERSLLKWLNSTPVLMGEKVLLKAEKVR
jgi:hypothetical protein